MIVDVHGHYVTAPPTLDAYRGRQLARPNKPGKARLTLAPETARTSLERREPLGTGNVINPDTGATFDDILPDLQLQLADDARSNVLFERALEVFPRLSRRIAGHHSIDPQPALATNGDQR
jgi:hypothetical protein